MSTIENTTDTDATDMLTPAPTSDPVPPADADADPCSRWGRAVNVARGRLFACKNTWVGIHPAVVGWAADEIDRLKAELEEARMARAADRQFVAEIDYEHRTATRAKDLWRASAIASAKVRDEVIAEMTEGRTALTAAESRAASAESRADRCEAAGAEALRMAKEVEQERDEARGERDHFGALACRDSDSLRAIVNRAERGGCWAEVVRDVKRLALEGLDADGNGEARPDSAAPPPGMPVDPPESVDPVPTAVADGPPERLCRYCQSPRICVIYQSGPGRGRPTHRLWWCEECLCPWDETIGKPAPPSMPEPATSSESPAPAPPLTLRVHRLRPSARVPARRHPGDLGLDLASDAPHVIRVKPGEVAVIPTGLACGFPAGHGGFIKGRSGLAAGGLDVLGGVVDQGFTGEIKVVVANVGEVVHMLAPGERIAQLVLVPLVDATACEVGSAGELGSPGVGGRGDRGFGSSGQ